jgi:hypothetical protein
LRALEQIRATTNFVEVPLRALFNAMEESGVEVPDGLQGLASTFRSEEWLQQVIRNVQSQYVANYSSTRGVEDGRMDRLIAEWIKEAASASQSRSTS